MEENSFLSRGCSECPKLYPSEDKVTKRGCNKLDVTDWLKEYKNSVVNEAFNIVEVRFKNSHKEYFAKPDDLSLEEGDIVAVETSPGHDIGIVSLTGELVRLQLVKKRISQNSDKIRKIYRKTRPSDIDKWISAIELEDPTMYKAKKIVEELNLNMKINDVEYQGDKTKAIFYYTAEERVDFRELIKILAEKFMVRIEMRQIGARQESGRIGGIASCGRELCCTTWITNFKTVTTNSARNQQLSINPQKLTGQCSKLKCCLNYENDYYTEVLKGFPKVNAPLKTEKGLAFFQKMDVLKKLMWFTYKEEPGNFIPISVEKVIEIQALNKEGKTPEGIELFAEEVIDANEDAGFENVVGQDDITRFDKKKKKKRKKKKIFKGPSN